MNSSCRGVATDPVRDALAELMRLHGLGVWARKGTAHEEEQFLSAIAAARAALAGGVEQQPTEEWRKECIADLVRDLDAAWPDAPSLLKWYPYRPDMNAAAPLRSEDAAPARLEDGDIVERLRNAATDWDDFVVELAHDALAEILRLRAQVAARPSNAAAARELAEIPADIRDALWRYELAAFNHYGIHKARAQLDVVLLHRLAALAKPLPDSLPREATWQMLNAGVEAFAASDEGLAQRLWRAALAMYAAASEQVESVPPAIPHEPYRCSRCGAVEVLDATFHAPGCYAARGEL